MKKNCKKKMIETGRTNQNMVLYQQEQARTEGNFGWNFLEGCFIQVRTMAQKILAVLAGTEQNTQPCTLFFNIGSYATKRFRTSIKYSGTIHSLQGI